MAGRGSSGKTTKRSGTSTRRTSSRTNRRKTTRKQQSRSNFEVSLRPEHQRELFALALITLALVTVIFFITGRTGGGWQYLSAGSSASFWQWCIDRTARTGCSGNSYLAARKAARIVILRLQCGRYDPGLEYAPGIARVPGTCHPADGPHRCGGRHSGVYAGLPAGCDDRSPRRHWSLSSC